jgi:hypothetical protein
MSESADRLLVLGLDDWLHFPDVVFEAAPDTPRTDDISALNQVLAVLRELLESELVLVGDVAEDGFSQWEMPSDEILRQVKERWISLRRPISFGDVCWLQNTPAGDRRAELALRRRRGD